MSGVSARDVEAWIESVEIGTFARNYEGTVTAYIIYADDWRELRAYLRRLAERETAIRDEAKAEALTPIRALIEEQRRTTPVASASPIDAGIRAADRDWIQRLTALLDGGDQS